MVLIFPKKNQTSSHSYCLSNSGRLLESVFFQKPQSDTTTIVSCFLHFQLFHNKEVGGWGRLKKVTRKTPLYVSQLYMNYTSVKLFGKKQTSSMDIRNQIRGYSSRGVTRGPQEIVIEMLRILIGIKATRCMYLSKFTEHLKHVHFIL